MAKALQLAEMEKGGVVGKISKSGPLRMHFQHSRATVRVFEQNTDIIKFKLFHSETAHKFFFSIFLFLKFTLRANTYEPLVVSV